MRTRPQLFCFTYAGGTAAFFDEIERELDGIILEKLEYAGHGKRHAEPFYKDFSALAEDMLVMVKEHYAGGPYALFGYSMGSIAAVEVLRGICEAGMREPSNIFLAAHEPHTKSELLDFSEEELDKWVKERTIQFGAVPQELLDNKTFWRVYLPVYRADYTIIGKYDFEQCEIGSKIPATFFYSETDTPGKGMRLWSKHFLGKCSFHCFSGSHFFIKEHYKEMANIIRREMGMGLNEI